MKTALILEDDPPTREAMTEIVEGEGFEVTAVGTVAEAMGTLEGMEFDALLLDVELPDGSGTTLLDVLPEDSETEVVFVTGYASVDTAVAALRGGAIDYLTKPVETRRLRKILQGIRRASELRERVGELDRELRSLGRFEGMVGSCPAMQNVYEMIQKVAPTDATVLILGETGTGKEEVARAVHNRSKRRKQPFVPVNCGAIPKELMESELFGHERGAFTGADKQRIGMFERANGGTLFLDEITEMSVDLQVNLLRVLETMEFRRVGGDKLIPVDVRILAATNRNPEEAVQESMLREDLLFRLAVFPVSLPPLRERGADIPLLAQAFLDKLNQDVEQRKRFTGAGLRCLESHQWTGNVRELRNAVERAYILADSEITPSHLDFVSEFGGGVSPLERSAKRGSTEQESSSSSEDLSIAEVERKHIQSVLSRMGGDKKQAAKALGISLKTLYNRLKKYEDH